MRYYLTVPSSCGIVQRPNKTAAGMTRTHARSGRTIPDGDELTLAVRGTLDALRGMAYYVTRGPAHPCPCCAQDVRRLRLNPHGRRLLRQARRRLAERREAAWRATRPHALAGHFTTGGEPCTCPRCGARPRGWDDLGDLLEGYDCANCGAAFIYDTKE